MAEMFKCPACSAPLEFKGEMIQKCDFCGGNVIAPSDVMRKSSSFGGVGALDFGDLSALTGKALKIAEVQELIRSGKKIQAIKVFRETFGVGLKEAKDAVEAIERGESVNISGMGIHTVAQTFQPKVMDPRLVKKAGLAFGGGFLFIFISSMIFTIGIIIAVFYFVSSQIDRAGEKSTFANSSNPRDNASKSSAQSDTNFIAREVLRFGGKGIGAGKFKDNRTVAFSPQGKIISADYSGGRIQVFDAYGNFQTQINLDPNGYIGSIAADRKGTLYVLESSNLHRIKIESGEILGTTQLNSANDLAVGLDGKIYLAMSNGEIHILDENGTKVKAVQISKDLNLNNLQQIAVDGTGNFLVIDGKTGAVFKLSPDGKLLTRFGGKSTESSDKTPKSMFSSGAEDLATDSQGRIYVSEISRVVIFDAKGNFLNDFETNQAFGLAFNDKDELFVASRPFVVKYKLEF
jgi:sugar lactone lactonase YvrE